MHHKKPASITECELFNSCLPDTCHFDEPATPANDVLPREALNQQLESGSARITLIHTPAGYGRTILLTQHYQHLKSQGAALVWIGCSNLERAEHQLSALYEHFQDADKHTDWQKLKTDQKPAVGAHILIDDAHKLQAGDGSRLLARLLDVSPSRVKFIISSRGNSPINLAQYRLRGELMEMSSKHLAFTAAENSQFLQRYEATVDAENVSELLRLTDGWPGGMSLAMQRWRSMEEPKPPALWEDASWYEGFFREEVFDTQATAIQDLLLSCSVLEQIDFAACDALRKSEGSAALLRFCAANDLFLQQDVRQPNSYRLHPLFRKFLAQQLLESSQQTLKNLHLSASEHFLLHNQLFKAYRHALQSNDAEHAAKIVDDNIIVFFETSNDDAWRLVEQLPRHVMNRYPRILLGQAWSMLHLWKFETAKGLLRIAREYLGTDEARHRYGDNGLRILRQELLHREAMLSMMVDDTHLLETQALALIDKYSEAHPIMRASVYNALLYAHRERFKLDEIEHLSYLAEEHLKLGDSKLSSVVQAALIGPARFMAGQTQQVVNDLRNALKIAEGITGVGSPYATILALPLAEVHYERNELAEARELLTTYLPLVEYEGFIDQTISGWLTAVKLACHDDNYGEAFALLDKADQAARQHGFERLRYCALAERMRLLLALGDQKEVLRLGRMNGLIGQLDHVRPASRVTTRDEARAFCCVRVAIAQGRLNDAIELCRVWQRFLHQADAVRNCLRWEVLHAHLLLLSGNDKGAQRGLKKSFETAARRRFVRTFVDEKAWLGGLLDSMDHMHVTLATSVQVDDFIEELNVLCRGAEVFNAPERQPQTPSSALPLSSELPTLSSDAVSGVLNSREIEILHLVHGGLRNKEIGRRLNITEGCVKWYMQQIFDKIGVRRRSQAVSRARQFGVIF
ncbi:LuxR C-terminal-related transcriptional regulator [Pseudomonas shirazensis]|uniref:LuxR C-terminal-related transcriptional regulator n=1 Tax=Pseudomonas shirazensis TaxID=2745494 RepID=A0ABU8ZVR5_9PSED